MSVLATKNPTLVDVAKSLGPDGKVAKIVEMLNQTNEVIDDMTVLEANQVTGHVTTIRTGLPEVYWRRFNQGVPASKSNKAQVTETLGMMADYFEVDKDLADLNGNSAEFRLSESYAHVEAMTQEQASTLFYGNEMINKEEFMGFAPRYSDLSAANAENIIDAGGTGSDNTSIWLVVWGPNTCHGIYPKGSQAGISHEDKGVVTIENANGESGKRMEAYRDYWQWKNGLVVRDWRYVVRIANIDVSALLANSSAADLIEKMIEAYWRIPSLGMGRAAWYVNRTVGQELDKQTRRAVSTGGQLSYETVNGKKIMVFRDIPIRRVDAILTSEARVV